MVRGLSLIGRLAKLLCLCVCWFFSKRKKTSSSYTELVSFGLYGNEVLLGSATLPPPIPYH